MGHGYWRTACLCLCICLGTFGQTAPVPSPDLSTLIRQLADDDFHVRDAAQRRLDAVTYRQRDALQKLADEAIDPEVKSRLMVRIDKIDEESALSPPPISIDVKNATLPEVGAALTKAGVPIDGMPPKAAEKDDRFTLTAVEQPFWEIIRQLSSQHPLAITSSGGRMRLSHSPTGLRQFTRSGGFIIYPLTLQRTSSLDPQRDPPAGVTPPRYVLRFEIVADPRMHISQTVGQLGSVMIDDKGNELPTDPKELPRGLEEGLIAQSSNTNILEQSIIVEPKAVAGTLTAKGEAVFQVQMLEQSLNIPDLKKLAAGGYSFANSQVVLKNPTLTADRANFTLERNAITDPGAPKPLPSVMTVVDATGAVLLKNNAQTTGSRAVNVRGPFVSPLSVQFSAPRNAKVIRLPFEFKELIAP